MPTWLRLVIGAFVVSAWMTVALAGGTAHADSAPPSDGPSPSEGAPKADPPKRLGGLHERLTKHRDSEAADRGPLRNRVDAARGLIAKPDRASVDGNARIAAVPSTPESGAVVKPKPRRWQLPAERHGDNQVASDRVTLKPAKPVRLNAVAPKPPTQTRLLPRAVDPKPLAANAVPTDPVAPKSSTATKPVDVAQLGRQGVGLVSDVGVVAASAVYTVADTVAQAVGPNRFAGVPYALAMALANTAAAAGRAAMGDPLDTVGPGRFPVAYGVFQGLPLFTPTKPPPGANDPTITVTDEHPLPIILLNGTGVTQGVNWTVGAPVLANAGYKVYTFNYGNTTGNPNSLIQATGDISQSAQELDDEIDRVLAETGAQQVILIGHSQGGGILPAYYINNVDGGAEKVSQVIGIAPSNHGTDFNGLVGLLRVPILGPLVIAGVNLVGPAAAQQLVGSDFQDVVYGEQDTDPRVSYTNIITMNDEVVTPYTQQALEGDNVTNIILQERYPGYIGGHAGVVVSPQVWDIVLDELEKNPAANPQLHDEVVAA